MTADELKAELAVEFDALRQVVNELEALRSDVAGREPTVREKTAAAAFLAQFYSGLENILKRLSRFHGVELPAGEKLAPGLVQAVLRARTTAVAHAVRRGAGPPTRSLPPLPARRPSRIRLSNRVGSDAGWTGTSERDPGGVP